MILQTKMSHIWRYTELRFLGDRKSTPLHGVIYVALVPSAAAWNVEMS
ncbi:MAG: hypothetical protein FWH18_11460 [Marinilabiliaceae bacterium]|nr:hypothetical protein [Marinilabiliaceae bacterium]